jgi:hypothetical protein
MRNRREAGRRPPPRHLVAGHAEVAQSRFRPRRAVPPPNSGCPAQRGNEGGHQIGRPLGAIGRARGDKQGR